MPGNDYAEHPRFAMASQRMWDLLQYRYILRNANLTYSNAAMAIHTEAMRYRARVIRCSMVPSALNAMQVVGNRLHTLECHHNVDDANNPFHPTAPLCLWGSTLCTLIVHSNRAIRCFAQQFVHLTRLSSLTASVQGVDIQPVLSALPTLTGLSHLDLNVDGVTADMDTAIVTNGLTHANLRSLHLRIAIRCDIHCNHVMDILGQLGPARLPSLRVLRVIFVCPQSIAHGLPFHRLTPLFGGTISDFSFDILGPDSTWLGMSMLDALERLLANILQCNGIRAVRFGAYTSLQHCGGFTPPDTPPSRGIRSLVLPAPALGACMTNHPKAPHGLRQRPTILERMSDLTSLHLHVGNNTKMDHLHTIIVALLPQLQTLVINGCALFASCECSHTVALFDAILQSHTQQVFRPLLQASLKVTVPTHLDLMFRGLESLAARGLQRLELRLTGSLGDAGTQRLMDALSAASATLKTLTLSGAVVLYDVLLSTTASVPFGQLHHLDVIVSVDSVKRFPDCAPIPQLRFPDGLKKISLRSFHNCVADFNTMCGVTRTLCASAATIASVEIVDIQWLNLMESLSQFGAHLGPRFEKLTQVRLLLHGLHSHNTLGFVCGGLVRLPNLANLNITFADTDIHAVVGRTLSKLETLVTFTLVLTGSTRIPYGAEDALAMVARIPTLSDVCLYDVRIRANENGLGALDAALRHRRLYQYKREMQYGLDI